MDWWKSHSIPNEPGWYPVLICYDGEEGVFPQGAWFDGKKWDSSAVVAFGDHRQGTKELATEPAYAHDPDR